MTLHVPNLTTDVSPEIQGPSDDAGVRRGPYQVFFKRVLDVTLVLLSAPFVLPVIVFLALVIALTGNMPFYSQARVGRCGKSFRMWKLRTMVMNADEYLETYLQANPDAQREWLSCQKLKDDPRVTSLGRILRKTSIDELPQLFNVLNGTMSLVGPRPMMPDQKRYYHGQAYYTMRPGITGPWQTSGRNYCSTFQERVGYDDAYSREMSFKTDLQLLFKTVGVVLRATGN
jgi:lipopolysaccharide/colanic/teichoic acid biosynthesis glycosyltransferase